VLIGSLFAAFGHVVGETAAGTLLKLRDAGLTQQMLVAVVAGITFGGVLLGLGLVAANEFRNAGLSEVAGRRLSADFVGWLQAVSVFVACASAMIWRYGQDGRDLIAEVEQEEQLAAEAEKLVMSLTAKIDGTHAAEARYVRDAIKARELEKTLDEKAEAEKAEAGAYGEYLWSLARLVFEAARYRVPNPRGGSEVDVAKRKRVALIATASAGVLTAAAAFAAGLGILYAVGIGLAAASMAFFVASNPDPAEIRRDADAEPREAPGADRPTPESVNAGAVAAEQNGHGDRSRIRPPRQPRGAATKRPRA
jgi:hypothetical protein